MTHIPPRYVACTIAGAIAPARVAGVRDKEAREQEILRQRAAYKQGRYVDPKRYPEVPEKKSDWTEQWRQKHPDTPITNLTAVSRLTGIPVHRLKQVVAKGRGAYYSSGSRPNQTPHSWAYARLASVLLGGPALQVDRGEMSLHGKLYPWFGGM